MQKIVPHLWFDKEAREAADFYVSLFDSSRLVFTKVIKNPPPFGDAEIVGFEICGINFVAISAGPYFKINSSISLTVACTDDEEFSKLRNALIEGGSEVFCENGPTNEKTCTICDRFGVTWVLMSNKGQAFQKITPSFHFSGEVFGKAEEAARYYAEVFSSSEITDMVKNEQGDKVKRAEITLDGFKIFAANIEKGSPFNEAFSFIVT